MTPQKKNRWKFPFLSVGILILICTSFYDPTRKENTSGDNISCRYWPICLLKKHTYTMEPFAPELGDVRFAGIVDQKGTAWLPRVDLGIAVFSVPFYAVVDFFNWGGEYWTHNRISSVSRWNAILLCVTSVVLLYLLLLEFVPPHIAMISSLIFALGTWHWSVGAQGLSSQTAAVLCHMIRIHLLLKLCRLPSPNKKGQDSFSLLPIGLGIFDGFCWLVRSADLLFLPAALFGFKTKRNFFFYLVTFAFAFGFDLALNYSVFGNVFGYRGLFSEYITQKSVVWTFQIHRGLPGLLFSPNRGAITFFPLLLLVPYFWKKLMPPLSLRQTLDQLRFFRLPVITSSESSLLPSSFGRCLFAASSLYLLSISSLEFWHSTWSYGPRYLYDLLPYVWIPITLGIYECTKAKEKSKFPQWVAILTLFCSLEGIFVHAMGHEKYHLYLWNHRKKANTDRDAWDFSDPMLLEVWRSPSNRDYYPDAFRRLKKWGY